MFWCMKCRTSFKGYCTCPKDETPKPRARVASRRKATKKGGSHAA